jgi:hypothetical protein
MFAHKTEEILLIVMSEKCNGMLQYNIYILTFPLSLYVVHPACV